MKPLTRVGLFLLPFALTLLVLAAVVVAPAVFTVAHAQAGLGPTSAAGFLRTAATGPAREGAELVELEVHDVVPLEELGTHAVMLVTKDGEAVLPIFVSEEAAVSIAFRLAERQPPHPLAADLMDNVLDGLGGEVTEIRIDDIREEVFTGRVFIRQGDKQVKLDARPSDAICMALGGQDRARIFATRKVMAEGGISRAELQALGEGGPGVGGSGPFDEMPGPMPLMPLGPPSGTDPGIRL